MTVAATANWTPLEEKLKSLGDYCVWQLHLAHFGSLIWPTPGLPF